ncbi:putative glycoside hydrolase [Umezawaea sp. Da 62-37]|uniref:putative glycoside hydrolase n=1 Tax=Umezawaea sp. Da 62-37 TaxID=3075927 RepID=UPI0028F74E4C|nr:putative glycoside hydrolase [Umezawaea sp. Da 62-37]WNV83936.1 putative glycoside hydrolase [Umezawaea sp. Da 62-37]
MTVTPSVSKRGIVIVAVAVAATAITATTVSVVHARGSALVVQGIEDGAVLRSPDVGRLVVSAADGGSLDDVEVSIDGVAMPTRHDGDRLTADAADLSEGEHTLAVSMRNPIPFLPGTTDSRVFTVDDTAPAVSADAVDAVSLHGPVTVAGKAEGASSVLVGEQRVPVDADGSFTASLAAVPERVRIEATDAAGNSGHSDLEVRAHHPGMRAVHMSAQAWGSEALREPVLAMARDKRIDTVQLDVKDESGEIGYDSQVPMAKKIGAGTTNYDAREVLDQLHGMGVRVVGRLVAFRDPVLAKSAWESGSKDMVVQDEGGTPWSGGYGGYAFTNFANPEVRGYNIDLATEAASLGFDDVLYDYVRRPDGPLARMVFPGLATSPEQSIAEFLGDSRKAVRPKGAFLGASVFGIAARSGSDVAQDIPAIATHVDYIAPMVYPSHWGPGEYGVADPEGQPHDIVRNSVGDFVAVAKDSGVAVIPWLQAFSLAKTYGPAEVQAQVSGSAEAGAESFLLWNAACAYESAGLLPR